MAIKSLLFKLVVPLSASLIACSSATQPEKPKANPTPPLATEKGETGDAAISGVLTFAGEVPKEPKNPAASFAECTRGDPGDRHKAYRVKDGKLENAFIYIKEGLKGSYPAPTTPVTLDQQACAYVPRVFGLQVGQELLILNSDPFLHNVHALPKASREFNAGMPVQGMKLTRKFETAEVMVALKCDVHGWMRAYVGVLTHPFFSVSKEDGSFAIKNVPAGNYTVEAWHEKLGTKTAQVKLSAKQTQSITFDF